jgi:trehalose-phosphatase
VIHDAESVPLGELRADCAERGIRNPRIAVLPDLRAHQPRRSARQVPRVGRELVHLGRRARDVHVDVLDVLDSTTPCERAGPTPRPTASLAWHYRAADAEYGASQAYELRVHLTQILSNEPVELLAGDHVIEVRPHGLQKGRIAREVSASAPAGAVFVGMGDDRTDEDLFAALPPDGVAIHVGPRPSQAAFWLSDTAAARRFLRALATPS